MEVPLLTFSNEEVLENGSRVRVEIILVCSY